MTSSRRVPVPDRLPASPLRLAVERRSAVPLVALSQLPRWALPGLTALLLAGGVLLPAAAAVVCLALLLVLVGWLSYLSWPAVDGRGRVVRLVFLGLVVLLGVTALG